jgi:hypothetical protein
MDQVLSIIGAALVLGAFGLLQTGRMHTEQVSYQLANVVGPALLATAAIMTEAWAFVVLNVVWGVFAAFKLAEIARARHETA